MNRVPTSFVAAAAAMTFAGAAAGDIIEMQFLGTDEGRNVRISHGPSEYSQNVFAGGLRYDVVSTGRLAFLGGEQTTYCVDIHESVSRDMRDHELNTASLRGDQRTTIAAIFGASDSIFGLASERDRQAATQLLIWETVYDSGDAGPEFNFASGDFTATRTNGNALWNSLQAATDLIVERLDPANAPGLFIATNDGSQDQALVPAPASLSAIGLGLLASRRRR